MISFDKIYINEIDRPDDPYVRLEAILRVKKEGIVDISAYATVNGLGDAVDQVKHNLKQNVWQEVYGDLGDLIDKLDPEVETVAGRKIITTIKKRIAIK